MISIYINLLSIVFPFKPERNLRTIQVAALPKERWIKGFVFFFQPKQNLSIIEYHPNQKKS